GATKISLDRSGANGCYRRKLRRIHDQLDRRPHRSLQSGGDVTQRLKLHFGRWHARWRLRTLSGFRRRYFSEDGSLLGPLAFEVCEECEDSDLDSALRQRLSRADRARRTMVSCAQALWRND